MNEVAELLAQPRAHVPPRAEHRCAAVFALLVQRAQTNVLLIKRCNRGDPWSDQIAFPGGHIDEADDDALAAAFREVDEEVDIPEADITLLGDLGHFQTRDTKMDLHAFVGWWNARRPARPHPAEVAEIIEVPVGQLLAHNEDHSSRIPPDADPVYPTTSGVVWGVTARILTHLLGVLAPVVQTER